MASRHADKWRTVAGQIERLCPGCGEWKPHTAAFFYSAGGGRLKGECKPCACAAVIASQRRAAAAKVKPIPVLLKPPSSVAPEVDERALQLARIVRARIDTLGKPQALFNPPSGRAIRTLGSYAYEADLRLFPSRLVGVYDQEATIRDIADDILEAQGEKKPAEVAA